MISVSLSRRDRRVLIIGAVAIGSIVAFGKGWPAIRTWEAARVAAAAEVRERLTVAERNAALMPFVRDSAASRARRLEALRSRLIRGASADAAAASLGALVEKIAADEGVDVLTMTLRPDTLIRHGLARVAVRFGAEGDVDGLINLLTALEGHDRPLVVRELSVVQPEPMAPASRAEALRFDLTVETVARVGSASPNVAAGWRDR